MPLHSLLERLRRAPEPAPAVPSFPRKKLAVAALLVEAAQIDRHVDKAERAAMARLVQERLDLPAGEAARLLEVVSGEFAAALDDWVFTQAVREGFSEVEREDIFEMIWEVVYADGRLARFEDQLMQRLAESLAVDARAADRARERAFARMSAGRGGEA